MGHPNIIAYYEIFDSNWVSILYILYILSHIIYVYNIYIYNQIYSENFTTQL